jgi:uncharacterized OsmC-like protein
MRIRAQIHNQEGVKEIKVTTGNQSQSIVIPPKSSGFGSNVNGGELLCLALATCFCNDVYREARRLDVKVQSVDVLVEADFGSAGEPGRNFVYKVAVKADASDTEIQELIRYTDTVAEIHNTLRLGAPIRLLQMEPDPIESPDHSGM